MDAVYKICRSWNDFCLFVFQKFVGLRILHAKDYSAKSDIFCAAATFAEVIGSLSLIFGAERVGISILSKYVAVFAVILHGNFLLPQGINMIEFLDFLKMISFAAALHVYLKTTLTHGSVESSQEATQPVQDFQHKGNLAFRDEVWRKTDKLS